MKLSELFVSNFCDWNFGFVSNFDLPANANSV